MEISKAALGVIAAVCIGAGAGGAYLATRPEAPVPPDESAVETAVPVDETEAVVEPAAPPPGPQPVEAAPAPRPDPPAPAPVRRASRAPAPAPRARETEADVAALPADEPRFEAPLTLEPPNVTSDQVSLTLPPPGPVYDELVVAADSVIGLQIESTITTEDARVEDAVRARVTRDVRVGDRVAIPAGSRAIGEVTMVERGGRLRERARLGVRFTSIVLADGTELPIATETIYREGESPGAESAAKIGGGAIGGAIIGGILGGAKGAAIGSAVGAGAGSGVVLAGGRNPATLNAGTPVTVRLEEPVVVTVER